MIGGCLLYWFDLCLGFVLICVCGLVVCFSVACWYFGVSRFGWYFYVAGFVIW